MSLLGKVGTAALAVGLVISVKSLRGLVTRWKGSRSAAAWEQETVMKLGSNPEMMKVWLMTQLQTMYGLTPEAAAVIVAQAVHETGNFSSGIFRQNNNLFGMKLPRQRETTATGERAGHATYSNYFQALADYFMYLESVPHITPRELNRNFAGQPEAYASFLHSYGYFTAPLGLYARAVAMHYNNIIRNYLS